MQLMNPNVNGSKKRKSNKKCKNSSPKEEKNFKVQNK